MIDVEEVIRSTARTAAIDPDVALAVARQESGLNPQARGDRRGTYGIGANDPRAVDDFCSFGLFQENVCGGAGQTHLQRGGSFSDLFDPIGSTVRFAERYRHAAGSFVGASPGQIAAAAQRPYDPDGYARSIDGMLAHRSDPPANEGADAVPTTTDDDWQPAGWQCAIIATTSNADPGVLSFLTGIPRERLQAAAYKCAKGVGDTKVPGEDAPLLGGIAQELANTRKGATQLTGAIAVLGIAGVLGYMGLRKTIG